jgi:hypothetical protein
VEQAQQPAAPAASVSPAGVQTQIADARARAGLNLQARRAQIADDKAQAALVVQARG